LIEWLIGWLVGYLVVLRWLVGVLLGLFTWLACFVNSCCWQESCSGPGFFAGMGWVGEWRERKKERECMPFT
jgi:hypothetical protein